MELFIEQFHFLRPLWFISLLPALIIAFLLYRNQNQQGQWNRYLPAHLSAVLIEQGSIKQKTRTPLLLLLAWLFGIIALAGPTWQKIEQPLFKIKQANIIIVDMSLSMYATDMSPNRLTRAKYKLTDLLKQLGEGETGLIAFAGDAFVISPMTSDIANLLNLLPSLNPSIMPAFGSRPDLAIEKALELLAQSQYKAGQIYLLADDIAPSQSRSITTLLKNSDVELNIMAIGTGKGAPIKLPNEQLLKDDGGNIVIPQLPLTTMASLASTLDGRFAQISNDQSDIATLLPKLTADGEAKAVENQFGDRWQEVGPLLVLVLLPFVALSCRKGVLTTILASMLVVGTFMPPPLAAQEPKSSETSDTSTKPGSWWTDLWRTGDQQGYRSYQSGDHQQALAKFDEPKWRGASQYQAGQYQDALASFEQSDNSDALFNQGNALVQLAQYEEAIRRYEKALVSAKEKSAIEQNLTIAQQLLDQQKQQQKQQQGENSESDQQNKDQQQDSNQEQQSDQQGQQQDQQGQENQSANNKSEQSQPGQSSEQQQEDGKQSQGQQGKQQEDGNQEKPLTPEEQQEAQKQQQQQQQKAAQLNETFNKDNLSKEELAHLNQLVKKVNDDPSLLLKNKMAVEARKRQRQRTSNKEHKNW